MSWKELEGETATLEVRGKKFTATLLTVSETLTLMETESQEGEAAADMMIGLLAGRLKLGDEVATDEGLRALSFAMLKDLWDAFTDANGVGDQSGK